jgi:ankyrin repeat protein
MLLWDVLGASEMQRYALDSAFKEPPFVRASSLGHDALVKFFLDMGWSPNQTNGHVPLVAAAKFNRVAIVDLLIAAGAHAEEYNDGTSALQTAAKGGFLAVVDRLLAAGADARISNPHDRLRSTPLQAAAAGGFWSIVELLLIGGADPNDTRS